MICAQCKVAGEIKKAGIAHLNNLHDKCPAKKKNSPTLCDCQHRTEGKNV